MLDKSDFPKGTVPSSLAPKPKLTGTISDIVKETTEQMEQLLGRKGNEEEKPSSPSIQLQVIQEKSRKVDCRHPHARRCWQLLHRSLTNDYQALYGTDQSKIDEANKQWDQFKIRLLTPEWVDREKRLKMHLEMLVQSGEEANAKANDQSDDISKAASIIYVAGEKMKEKFPSDVDIWEAIGLRKKMGVENQKPLEEVLGLPGSQPNTLQRNRSLTIELVTMIDMAIGVGDMETYQTAMSILQDVNPSAHKAIECLAGVPGFAMAYMPNIVKRDPTKPTVPNLLQGIYGKIDEDISGGLTGIVYFKESSEQLEYAGILQILGNLFVMMEVAKFIGNELKEMEQRAHRSPEERAFAEKVDTMIVDAYDQQKASIERNPFTGNDLELNQEIGNMVRLRNDVINGWKTVEEGETELKLITERIDQSLMKIDEQKELTRRLIEEQEAKMSKAKKQMDLAPLGPEVPKIGEKIPSTGAAASSPGALNPVGKEGGSKTPKIDKPSGPPVVDISKGKPGTGGIGGDLPEPDYGAAPLGPDIRIEPGPEAKIKPVSESGDMVHDKGALEREQLVYQIERVLNKYEMFASTVRYTEEAFSELKEDEIIPVDLHEKEFSPLPGDLEELNNCFSADPDPEQIQGYFSE